jgi:hypothetical protein
LNGLKLIDLFAPFLFQMDWWGRGARIMYVIYKKKIVCFNTPFWLLWHVSL